MITVSTNADQVAGRLNAKARELRLVMQGAMEDVGKEAKRELLRPTAYWSHKPQVEVEIDTRGGVFELLAEVDDMIYNVLSAGRKGYFIKPVRARALRFMSGFRRKTTPGSLGAGHGGSFGDVRFSRGHWWPGIKARRFYEQVQKRINKLAPDIFRKRIRRWLG